MSYTPTVWNKGDIITVAKLNKIENGIASSGGNYDLEFYHVSNFSSTDNSGEELRGATKSSNSSEEESSFTAHGISVDELIEKIQTFTPLKIRLLTKDIYPNSQESYSKSGSESYSYNYHIEEVSEVDYDGTSSDSSEFIYLSFYNSGITFEKHQDESCVLGLNGTFYYTFTYDPTTKEYVFTSYEEPDPVN